MEIIHYIRENRLRSKHKLTSPKIKIINRSVLPQKKKTLVNKNSIKFVKENTIAGNNKKYQVDYRQHFIMP